jgi:hypothetical protein
VATENNLFAPPAGAIAGSIEAPASSDPNFRWNGQRTDLPKTPEVAARARQTQFPDVESFAAWRRAHGMPDLNWENLYMAWLRFRGETPGETAVLNPILERR